MPERSMSRLLAASCLALAAAAPSGVRAEVTLSGFLQQNTAFNTVAANPDGRHYKWLEERAQIKLDATGDAWRVLAKGDLAYDHLGRQDESELGEGYVHYAGGNGDL